MTNQDMNTPTPDYGEPWQESPTWNSVGTANGKFVLYEAFDMNEPYRSRAINCVNACIGMADPEKEISAMREVLREAHEALKELRSFYIEMTNLPPCAANAALAKLQPFIQ